MTPDQMMAKIVELEARLNRMEHSDRFVFNKLIQMNDGMKIQTGFTTGLYIGAAATQKVGFFGTAPSRQANVFQARTGFASNSAANMNGEDSTHTGGVGSTAVTFGDVVYWLKQYGLIPQ